MLRTKLSKFSNIALRLNRAHFHTNNHAYINGGDSKCLITFDLTGTLFGYHKPTGYVYLEHVLQHTNTQTSNNSTLADDITQQFLTTYKDVTIQFPYFGAQTISITTWWHIVLYNTLLRMGMIIDPSLSDRRKINDLNNLIIVDNCSSLSDVEVCYNDRNAPFLNVGDSVCDLYRSAEAYPLYNEVMPALHKLQDHPSIILGAISNSDVIYEQYIVPQLKLDSVLDFVITSMSAKARKPSPHIFQLAEKRALNRTNDSTSLSGDVCLHVGNDLKKDVFGSLDFGWNACWLLRSDENYDEYNPTMTMAMYQSQLDAAGEQRYGGDKWQSLRNRVFIANNLSDVLESDFIELALEQQSQPQRQALSFNGDYFFGNGSDTGKYASFC